MANERPHEQPQVPAPHGHRYARVPGDVAQTDVAAMAMQAQRSHMTENVYCIIWSLVSIAVLALACALLSMTQKERTTERLRGGEALLVDLANALMTLMNEAMYALYYTYNAASPDPKVPILEQQRQLSLLQSATLATVQQSARESAALCPECTSFFELLGYSGLLLVQNIARRRDFALTQVNSLYVDALTKYASALAYYLGISVNTVAAQMLRLESLVRAASGMGTMAQSWRGAHADAALLPSAYNMTSIYLAAIRGANVSVTSATAQQDIHGGGGGDDPAAAFARAVSAYVSNVTGVMSNVTGTFDDLHADNFDNHSATDLIGLLTTRFAESLTSITTTPQYKQQPSMRLLTVRTVLLAVIMVLLVIVNGIIVRDLCILAMHAERNLRKLRDVQRTQASLRRMSYFLDCLGRLDVRGMRATTTRSHRDATRTAAEDELMKLEAPALEVLAYIDPCILDCAAAAAASSAAAARSNATHVVVSTGDDDDGAAAAGGRGGGAGQQAHATGAAALPWLSSPSVVPLGLAPRNVCVLLADLSATFCNEVNHDSAKTMPKQVEMFAHTLASYARELGGVVMGTSGTVLMLGWNVLTAQQQHHHHHQAHSAHANTQPHHHRGQRHVSYQQQQHHPQPANAACAMLLRVRDSLAKSHPQVRYAVVSSTCPAGVVGSATLHSFVLASPLLQLGRLLLHVARLHDVCFVVDSITCRLVDECVCKRALERVALSPATVGHPDGDTIVYELTPLTASEYESVALWNDAFDCLQACSLTAARAKAAAWERRYGATTSLRRFVRLLHEKPTPRTHTFLAMSASSSGRHAGIDLETIM